MESVACTKKPSKNDSEDKDRQLVLLYNECVEFLDNCGGRSDPIVDAVRRMAGSVQNEVSDIRKKLWDESDVQLGPEYYDIDPGVPLCDVSSGSSWWEGLNIFDVPSTSLHARLLYLRPPEDSIAYANYIRDQMTRHLTYHGRRPARVFTFDMDQHFHYSKSLTRACEEIQRIYDHMPNGQSLALDLYLELKVNILQFPTVTILDWAQTNHHKYISRKISETLRSSTPHHSLPPWTFTRCRKTIKERMQRHHCAWGHGRDYGEWIRDESHCIHDMLVPDLDLFQRYAYFEVRDSVHLAIAKRLPAELIMLVFEQAMAAEGLTLDPRVLVKAHRRDPMPMIALKSRLECSHLLRCPDEWSKRLRYGCAEPDEDGPECVVGSEWKEVLPHFPHSHIHDTNDIIALDI